MSYYYKYVKYLRKYEHLKKIIGGNKSYIIIVTDIKTDYVFMSCFLLV